MPFLSGYTLRKEITIDDANVDGNLTDFPLLVEFTDDADIGAAIDAGGLNIRFTEDDGETLLKYERQSFDNTGSEATGRFWVKVPSILASGGGTIYIYYKGGAGSDGADPTNVWDSNFAAVYHLEEDPSGGSGAILDSTSNTRHGTAAGDMTSGDLVSTPIGNGLNFDHGTSDLFRAASHEATTLTREIIARWLVAGASDYPIFVATEESGTPLTTDRLIRVGGGVAMFVIYDGATKDAVGTTTIASETWYHLAGTTDGSAVRIVVNGTQEGSTAAGAAYTGYTTPVFRAGSFNGTADIEIAEIRDSLVVRADAWLKFTYRNIFEADNEIAFGAEEEDGGGGGLNPLLLLACDMANIANMQDMRG